MLGHSECDRSVESNAKPVVLHEEAQAVLCIGVMESIAALKARGSGSWGAGGKQLRVAATPCNERGSVTRRTAGEGFMQLFPQTHIQRPLHQSFWHSTA